MSDPVALLGYLPEFYLFRRRMLQQLQVMWRLYFALVVFMWVFMPWQLGWRGVGLALWTTFWCAWSRFWIWFGNWGRIRVDT